MKIDEIHDVWTANTALGNGQKNNRRANFCLDSKALLFPDDAAALAGPHGGKRFCVSSSKFKLCCGDPPSKATFFFQQSTSAVLKQAV